ncbi:hypothetical protein [Chitinophaga alhagiae]|uniref:hypothetical protein n=1 Tax=Chitinophaga alhagiae TaxID=2203219 RepID=UPI000E5C2804|nr:hypothetical protein [Chitinophaga alhagiae]
MGKQTGLIKFTGRVGELIGYRVGKQHYVRSMPAEVRQSPRTKISSRYFGKASTLGAAMRHAVGGLLDIRCERAMGNRLNKALLNVLREDDLHRQKRFVPRHFRGLEGFSLNQHADLSRVLTVTPSVSRNYQGNIEVHLPAMEVYTANPLATHLSIKAVAICVQPGFTAATAVASEPVLIDVSRPSAALTLAIPAEKGALYCVVLEVMCCIAQSGRMHLLYNRRYSAADVVAVMPGQEERVPRPYTVAVTEEAIPFVPGLVVNFHQRE